MGSDEFIVSDFERSKIRLTLNNKYGQPTQLNKYN